MQDSFIDDARFTKALILFNSNEWYNAHDVLEEIWHETSGEERKLLQGILQIAVAQVHLENNNNQGALMLYGEALKRLIPFKSIFLELNIKDLCRCIEERLSCLQQGDDANKCKIPFLIRYNS